MKRLFTIYGICAVLALVLSYVFGGQKGLFGMTLGLGSTAFNIISFRLAVYVMGKMVAQSRETNAATAFGVVALFVKLPVWCVCAIIAQRNGGAVLNCFLFGLALVYFGAVGWAQAKNC